MEKRTKKKTGACSPVIAFLCTWFFFTSDASAEAQCVFMDSALVNDTIIRLGDIAVISETSEALSARLSRIPVGEAAPAGYSRFVNVDEVIRHALRGEKSIRFESNNSTQRIWVKTGFQEVTLEAYEKEFAEYVRTAVGWKDGDYHCNINYKDLRLKCLNRPYTISFEGPASKYPKGSFILKFNVLLGGKKISAPVSAFISITTPVIVSSTNLRRGEALSQENCRLEKVDITHFNYLPYTTFADIENRILSRSIESGSIIHDKNTASIPMVTRDDQVQLIVNKGNITVSINARARGTGGLGKSILVENEMTHKLIKVKIIKPGQVVLLQGDGKI